MNWMKRHLIYINMVWASMLLLGSCTSESGTGTPDVTPVVPSKPTNNTETAVSQDEIKFQITTDENQEAVTREATLYNNLSTLQAELSREGGAGNFFHVDAFYDGETSKYIDSHVFYFSGGSGVWTFADNTGSRLHYYWPPSQTLTYLNFLAYYPEVLTHTGVSSVTYSSDKAPVINCKLPLTNNQTFDGSPRINMREFIYAFEERKNKTEHAESGVTLDFMHPFAAVYFRIGQAKQLMTLNSIILRRIFYQGASSYNSVATPKTSWTPSGSSTDFTMSIGKQMGTTMQKGSEYGPFIVMPQAFTGRAGLSDIKIAINYTPYSGSETTTSDISLGHDSWIPGKKYIYTLDLGQDEGNINVSVSVVDWDDQGNNTQINVD